MCNCTRIVKSKYCKMQCNQKHEMIVFLLFESVLVCRNKCVDILKFHEIMDLEDLTKLRMI